MWHQRDPHHREQLHPAVPSPAPPAKAHVRPANRMKMPLLKGQNYRRDSLMKIRRRSETQQPATIATELHRRAPPFRAAAPANLRRPRASAHAARVKMVRLVASLRPTTSIASRHSGRSAVRAVRDESRVPSPPAPRACSAA